MKQFNLDEYLKNPNRKIITRDGKSVRIVCTNKLDNNYPVVALIHDGDCEKCYSYTTFGKLYTYQNRDYELDLFFVTEKHEGWINIYLDTDDSSYVETCIYKSKEEAEENGKKWRCYITTVKIEWEE